MPTITPTCAVVAVVLIPLPRCGGRDGVGPVVVLLLEEGEEEESLLALLLVVGVGGRSDAAENADNVPAALSFFVIATSCFRCSRSCSSSSSIRCFDSFFFIYN